MRLAFYAPLKSPDDPMPSGERTMARLLLCALQQAGHAVRVISHSRGYLAKSAPAVFYARRAQIGQEMPDILAACAPFRPQAYVCYHPYYKAPDFLGQSLCAALNIPYVAVEASIPGARKQEAWPLQHAYALKTVSGAAMHVCFTARDREGLAAFVRDDALVMLKPFLDTRALPPCVPPASRAVLAGGSPLRLIAVAMMRARAKLTSYAFLAQALGLVKTPWRLTIVGDGPERSAVERLFASFPAGHVHFTGTLGQQETLQAFATAQLHVWPGLEEAYGMVYLEAASMGTPSLALDTAGVSAVIEAPKTGLCIGEHTPQAYGAALDALAASPQILTDMGKAACAMARGERTLTYAAQVLNGALAKALAFMSQ